MKLINLYESIDFIPSYRNKETGYQESPSEEVDGECSLCDGDGKDYNDETQPCRQCEGKGKYKSRKYTVPTLNVSNDNGYLILQMLGLHSRDEDNSIGTIPNKDLPEIRRKLIMLKNKDNERNSFTRDGSDTRSPKTSYVDKSGDVPQIRTQGGGRVIDMGTSDSQINRYIDKLLEIISIAQEKGFDVSWH